MGPSSASTRSKAARTAAGTRTPTLIGKARRPYSRTIRATSDRSSCGLASTATSAPSRASVVAVASPMPEEAPVTKAMRSVISSMCSSLRQALVRAFGGPDPLDLLLQPVLQRPLRRVAEVTGGPAQVELDLPIPFGQVAGTDVVPGVGQELREQLGGFVDAHPVAARHKIG